MVSSTPTHALPPILEILVSKGQLRRRDLDVLREAQAKDRASIEDILIRRGVCTDHEIAALYAEHYLLPQFEFSPESSIVPEALSDLLPEKLCRDHLIAPVADRAGTLDVVFFTPNELLMLEELHLLTGREIQPMFASLSAVESVLGLLYDDAAWRDSAQTASTNFEEIVDDDATAAESSDEDVIHLDQPAPPGRDGRIIRLVNQIFEQAFQNGASDIHIEPFEKSCRVRLRVDGGLSEIAPPPMKLFTAVVSRIKVLAKMDIAEKRMPQDGAIALRTAERRIDLRVNTVPTVYGEKIVMRVLDMSAVPLELTSLGLDQQQADNLAEAIEMPHGLLLVTGPTGSGKSTTLYACLNRLNTPDSNICTVEDPVEYKFEGINQIQTKHQVGLDFASALRAFLRQDPDVIMVGEVRDGETAQICLRAALTGHFVLSSLHTNDALAAVNRLQDMGIEPFLLASTLRAVVAQRLIRRLCVHCRRPDTVNADTAERFGLEPGQSIYRAGGCKECRETGYQGRVGVFEVIRITPKMAELIQREKPLSELRSAAVEEGMKLLAHSALEKVLEGLTSLEEALSVTVFEE